MRAHGKPLLLALTLIALIALSAFADFQQIRELIRRGDFAEALRACERDLKLQPRDYQIWTLKGIALQGVGRNAESLAAFRQALTIEALFLPALQGAAQLEYQLRDPNCQRTLETILRVRPETLTAHAMLGVLAFERKDCVDAVRHFETAGEAAVINPAVKQQLGTCYFQLERWHDAETQFSQMLAVKDDNQIRYNLGLTQTQAKKPAAAVATLRPLSLQERPDPDALSLLASAHEANEQTPEAVDLLRRALALYPREERLYADLATICLENNAFDIGTEILEAGAKNIPGSARIQAMLGVMHASAGYTEKAQAFFKRAEQLAPDAQHGRVGLAISLMQSGAAEQAVRMLREQAARTPDDPLISFTLAEALLQKGDASEQLQREAQMLLQQVVKRQPGNARAFSLLGKIYFRQQDTINALRNLETAVRLNAQDRAASYQLMTIYQRTGRASEAAALKEKVQKLREAENVEEAGRYRLVRVPADRVPQ